VIVKGGARTGRAGYVGDLAKHLQRTDTNEQIVVRELRGVAADDLRGALTEMAALAAGTRCTRPLYHANIDPHPSQPALTEEQKLRAVELLEKELGHEGQPRIVVEHVKEGRPHLHIVWSRIDLDRMVAIHDGHNYRAHEIAARELEREFGHQRVQGAHAEREEVARPERAPSDIEQRQAERSGITPAEAKAFVTGLWRATDSGQAFVAAIEAEGWIVAPGDKRDFVVVDPAGETHSLARRIEGAKAKDVRERMADVDPAALPTVREACARQEERARVAAELERGTGQGAAREPAPTPAAAQEQDRPRTAAELADIARQKDALDRARAIVKHADAVWEKVESGQGAQEPQPLAREDERQDDRAGEAAAAPQPEIQAQRDAPEPEKDRERREGLKDELKAYGEGRAAEGTSAKAAYLEGIKQRAAERARQEKERRDRERGDDGGRGRDR